MAKTDWAEAFKHLIKKYKGKKHPLEAKNLYQFFVMVILSAQTNDKLINSIAPELFKAFPDMASLARADTGQLIHYISKVRNFRNKANWLIKGAQQIKKDSNIPLTMEALTALPGIGRKSANVLMRLGGSKAMGIIVDLHVLRVAGRLGIAKNSNPAITEKHLMKALPEKFWGEAGMAMSFLGREICRPNSPACGECVMNTVCEYYKKGK